MSNPLQSQINLWWQAVSSEETLRAYQNAVQVTWSILRETTKLLWLFLCLGLVFFDWFRESSVQSGQKVKAWVDSLQEPKLEYAWAEVAKFTKSLGQSGTTSLLDQAREQLGLPKPESSTAKPAIASAPPSASVSAASSTSVSPASASSSVPSPPPSVSTSPETPAAPEAE
ncbi:MAG: hypothetical protein MH252_17060 [Thermosynechococcaceae cyanobacterium MS004]|nr:hypothetical protein [Thermosynechococcaceae cyanobacterium MS004]